MRGTWRRWRGAGLAVGLGLLLLALYGRALGRAFVSEDMLLLRQVHAAGPEGQWALLLDQFTGPWLDLTLVGFYRPIGYALLQLEWALFGTWTLGYGAAHLGLHLLNTVLLWRLLVTLAHRSAAGAPHGEGAAAGAAALFAIHPLHPNAVLFIASFATLLGTTWALLSLNLLLASMDGGTAARRNRLRAASLLTCLLACLSYEQFVVLAPLALLLAAWRAADDSGLRRAVKRLLGQPWLLAFPAVGVLHLALRRAALGESVGGYSSLLVRLRDPLVLLRDAWANWQHWWLPWYGPAADTATTMLCDALVLLFSSALLLFLVRDLVRRGARWRPLLLGLSWWLLAQAPFLFVGVVPGNGRYLYFASCGAALICLQLGQAVIVWARDSVSGLRRAAGAAALLCVLVWSVAWCLQLARLLEAHVEASRTVTSLRSELVAWVEREDLQGRPVAVVGAPPFVVVDGVNVAQTYHWGLADSLLSPWNDGPPVEVYALPHLGDRALDRLTRRSDLEVVRWRGDAEQPLQRVPRSEGVTPLVIESPVQAPIRGAPSLARLDHRSDFVDRLVLSTRGTFVVQALAVQPDGSRILVPCPDDVVASMRRLYGGGRGPAAFWWIERRALDGRLEALSDVFTLESCPPPDSPGG